MLKDLSDQKKLEKELVLAAIQSLKAKGHEVNAYTVANEAQISRSILYRNSELMDLIAQEKGKLSAESSAEDLLKRIEELEDRNRDLEEKIWDLEKQAENEHQEAWKSGYQAGMEEAVRRLGEGRTATAAAATPAEPEPSKEEPPQPPVEEPEQEQQQEEWRESIAPDNGQESHQPEILSSEQPASEEDDEDEGTSMVSNVAFARQESLLQTSEQPILQLPPDDAPAASSSASPPAPRGQWSKEGIYNAARSGPYVASSYNPLVELSWKDLETVYNFSVASLKDYAKNLPPPRDMATPTLPENYPEQQNQKREEAPQEQAQARPTTPPIYSQLDFGAPTDAVPNTVPNAARGAAARGDTADLQDPNRTADRLEAMDPRALENMVDLDSLDIFDDLDDYVDLDKIDIISDVQVPPPTDAEQQQHTDELRNLIKDRIQQANEMPGGPSTPISPPSQGAADAQRPGAGAGAGAGAAAAGAGPGRNKFVGGAKAGGEPQQQSMPPQVVRQIPQEIRKACLILGVRPEEMSQQIIMEAWKKQIASPGVHPDQGGDTESAIYLNTAKDTLVRWLDAQAPKLGKKFGQKEQKPPGKDPPTGTDPGANKVK